MEKRELEKELIRLELDLEESKEALTIVNKEIHEILIRKIEIEKQLKNGNDR